MIRKYLNISRLRNLFSNANFGNGGFSVAEFLVAFALLSVLTGEANALRIRRAMGYAG